MRSQQERGELLKKLRIQYKRSYFEILRSVLRGAASSATDFPFTPEKIVQRAFELADDFIIEYHGRMSTKEEEYDA